MMRFFILSLLFLLDEKSVVVNTSYNGKASKDSRTKLLIESVSSDLTKALAHIKKTIDFVPKSGVKIYVDFADDASIDNARASTVCNGKSVNIRFAVPKMIEDGLEREYVETFRHELTHAVVRTHMLDDDAYCKLPTWLRESVSVLVAGEKYRWTHVAWIKTKGSLTCHIDGLEKGDYDSWDMLEGYLALEYIEKKHGVEKLVKLLAQIFREHIDYQEAIKNAVDLDYEKFQKEALKYSKDYAKKIDGEAEYPEKQGDWSSKFIDKELTLKSNFVIEDKIEISEKIKPETFRVWVVGKDGWIHGDIPVEISNFEEKDGKYQSSIKIDMTRLSNKSGFYSIWYMVHDKEDNMKWLRLKIKI